jgi:hypothetical protein
MSRVMEMKTQIEKMLNARDHLSFVEMTREIDGAKGNVGMFSTDNDNVLIWGDVSQDFVDAVRLVIEGNAHLQGCTVLVYYIDGGVPRLPIAKSMKRKYKAIHWVPMTLCKSKAA